jgi:hypothetical protein
MSSGSPMRPSGTARPTAAFFSPSARCSYFANCASTWAHIGVSTTPGAMALTRMPSGAIASAADCV